MKRVLAIVFLAAVVFFAWWLFFKTDKPQTEEYTERESIAIENYSPRFAASLDRMLNSYFALKDAFVEGDTVAVKAASLDFIAGVDLMPYEEYHENDQIYPVITQQLNDIKANASPISGENNITEMRRDFQMISENLYPFLKTIGYNGDTLYWQNCPMAFNDTEPANWLSETREIVNPYLGKKDPKYGSGMLHCGEVKDVLPARK